MQLTDFLFFSKYPEHVGILDVNSFTEYQSKLAALKRRKCIPEEVYREVAGFSFEFVVGVLLNCYGAVPQFGVLGYKPTYVGSDINPDFGSDGFGFAFCEGKKRFRRAIVQIKYRANQSEKLTKHDFGNLPALVCTELYSHNTVNVTFVTTTNEGPVQNDAEHHYNCFLVKKFQDTLPKDTLHRVFVRVIDKTQLLDFDNIYFWWQVHSVINSSCGQFEFSEWSDSNGR